MTDILLGFTYITFSLKFREENEAGLMFWTGPGDFTFVRVFWWKDCGDIRCFEAYLYAVVIAIHSSWRKVGLTRLMLTLLMRWPQRTKLD